MLIKSGPRLTSSLGMTLIAAGSIWLASITGATSMWVIVALMTVSGLGFGFSITVFTIIVQSSVAWNMRGASTALNTFVRTLGQTIGIAALGTFLNERIASMVRQAGPDIASRISDDDLNKLLNPESASQLAPDIMNSLRTFLETGLENVFLVMAAVAVICLGCTLLMPKGKLNSK